MNVPVVIIGTGLAGYNVAREFRKLDSETPLLLITADDGAPTPSPCSPPALARTRKRWPEHGRTGAWRATQAEVRTHTRVSASTRPKRLWIGGNRGLPRPDPGLGRRNRRVPVEGDAAERFSRSTTSKTTTLSCRRCGKRRVLLLAPA